MNRREILTRAAALSGGAALFGRLDLSRSFGQAWATEPSLRTKSLTIVSRTIEVNGRAASVFGLSGPDSTPGLTINAGDTFDVALSNESAEKTLIHWHGLAPPWDQDGVPDCPPSGPTGQIDLIA